jgi:aminocarboxymuconate-semialdehyde decarboxylase
MNHEVSSVRPVDIHAHYFPQGYLDVLAEEGPRFNVEYRGAEEGFYIKTEVRFQGPMSYNIVDLKKRIADMDAQGTAVQAMSQTGPRLERWGQRRTLGISNPTVRTSYSSDALPGSRDR